MELTHFFWFLFAHLFLQLLNIVWNTHFKSVFFSFSKKCFNSNCYCFRNFISTNESLASPFELHTKQPSDAIWSFFDRNFLINSFWNKFWNLLVFFFFLLHCFFLNICFRSLRLWLILRNLFILLLFFIFVIRLLNFLRWIFWRWNWRNGWIFLFLFLFFDLDFFNLSYECQFFIIDNHHIFLFLLIFFFFLLFIFFSSFFFQFSSSCPLIRCFFTGWLTFNSCFFLF